MTDEGRFTTSTRQLYARWVSQEDATRVVNYAYAIGTTPGGTDLVPFTDVGTQTEITRTGLNLVERGLYYFTVRATNEVGLTSAASSSDGIRVNTQPPRITSANPSDNGRVYPPSTVPCQLTATDPSGDRLEYRFVLDGRVVRDWSTVPTFSVGTGALPSGVRTLSMEVQDPWDGEDKRLVRFYLFRKPLRARE